MAFAPGWRLKPAPYFSAMEVNKRVAARSRALRLADAAARAKLLCGRWATRAAESMAVPQGR
jgi:hypothetical protein